MKFLDVNINVNKIVDQLREIAEPAVQETLRVYIRNQIVNGSIGLVVAGLLFILATAGLVVLVHSYRKYRISDDTLHCDWAVAGGFVMVFGYLLSSVIGIVALQALLNPEYYAIQDLINTIKP